MPARCKINDALSRERLRIMNKRDKAFPDYVRWAEINQVLKWRVYGIASRMSPLEDARLTRRIRKAVRAMIEANHASRTP